MKAISNLEYISRSGLRVAVGHPIHDPYHGNPKSSLGVAVFQDGPVGLAWIFGEEIVEKHFGWRIQAIEAKAFNCIVVIGHWNAPLTGCVPPNNGLVFCPDGTVAREIELPKEIIGQRSSEGHALKPEGLSVVKIVNSEVEIWLSYWQGDWHEQRIYDPNDGSWGQVNGQYRST